MSNEFKRCDDLFDRTSDSGYSKRLEENNDTLVEENDELIKERYTLRKQLEVAKEALRQIDTRLLNDGRAWDIEKIDNDITNIIRDALAEIERIGGEK